MSTTALEQPRLRTKRRVPATDGGERDSGTRPSGTNGTTGTRRRQRDRLTRDAALENVDEVVDEVQNEGVWLDGPLALTLLPPLGSFLTGGDFIRDGLILALLFYYLRALIKTPWELYLKARARRPPPSLQLEPSEDEAEPEYIAATRALARSELRLAEIVYLGLCLLTPLLGVLLLRYGSQLLGADNSLTWFSTGLFVLSTGLRPWRHLIQLLTTRTDALHDIVHHPPVHVPSTNPNAVSNEALAASIERFNALEAELADLRDAHEQLAEERTADQVTLSALQSQLSSQLSTRESTTSQSTAEVRAILARVEESVEHLDAQLRNTSRAGELVRLDGEEKYAGLQEGLEALVKEVGELHQRVAMAATTAAAANAAATNAQQAVSAVASAGGAAKSPPPGRRASLAWSPPSGAGIDPWARDISPSGRKRRGSLLPPQPTSSKHLQLPQLFTPGSIGDVVLKYLFQAILAPVRISQNLLHKCVAILGVAATPTSPVSSPRVANTTTGTEEVPLVPVIPNPLKGKGKAL